jgi:hypothetical protein
MRVEHNRATVPEMRRPRHAKERKFSAPSFVATIGVASLAAVALVTAFESPGAVRAVSANPRPSHSTAVVERANVLAGLPAPAALGPFQASRIAGEGLWRPAGRPVRGVAAVYTTLLRLPDNPSVLAGVAWMDPKLLRATLYSGSLSPGGLNWKFTAPISRAASRTLVAAFSGGFLLKDSGGGYFSEGHLVAPIRVGAASLVIYRNGTATVGRWGRDVVMGPDVVAVRQNLNLLVDHGRPAPGLSASDTSAWGAALHGIANTPRSGLGVTKDGALVYVSGPMDIVDLAKLLVRAGAVRAMVLDMNPLWPVFATYTPSAPGAPATAANGKDLLATMLQSPARFFESAYARDFIAMSAR